MRKVFGFFLTLAFVSLFSSSVLCAEYEVVKRGGFVKVLEATDSTLPQLQCLNPGTNFNNLKKGDVIFYISNQDVKDAIQLCLDRMGQYQQEQEIYQYYKRVALRLQDWQICYVLPDCKGIGCQLVLALAKEYQDGKNK